MPSQGCSARTSRLALAGVLLLALLARLWGIDWGLPYILHPDEPLNLTMIQAMVRTGDLNPHAFWYPSLFYYVHALAYLPYYAVGRLLGALNSVQDIVGPQMIILGVGHTTLPAAFLLGRGLNALLGTLGVGLTYALGKRLDDDPRVGLLAALSLAVFPIAAWQAHMLTPDTLILVWLILCLYGAVGIQRRGRLGDYMLAGVAAGLAASTKYNAGMVVVAIVAAHLMRCGLRGLRDIRLYLALALTGLAFALTSPFVFLDWHTFMVGLRFDAKNYTQGLEGFTGNSAQWYLAYLWREGGPLALLALAGILRGARLRQRAVLVVASFAAAYGVFIASFVTYMDRVLLPAMPAVFCLSAWWLVRTYDRAIGRLSKPRQQMIGKLILTLGCLALLEVPLSQALRADLTLVTDDSRITGIPWIEANLPPGSKIAVEPYTIYVDQHKYDVIAVSRAHNYPPEWYVANNVDYLLLGEWTYARFYREPTRYPRQVAEYDALQQAFLTYHVLNDGGYEVRILKIKP